MVKKSKIVEKNEEIVEKNEENIKNIEDEEDEENEEVMIKPKKQLTEAQIKQRTESLRKAREAQARMRAEKKATLAIQSQPKPIPEPIPEPTPEPTPEPVRKLKPPPPKPRLLQKPASNIEELTKDEIKEYIRFKKQEEDNLKKIHLLKQQKENEERYMKAYSSLFNI